MSSKLVLPKYFWGQSYLHSTLIMFTPPHSGSLNSKIHQLTPLISQDFFGPMDIGHSILSVGLYSSIPKIRGFCFEKYYQQCLFIKSMIWSQSRVHLKMGKIWSFPSVSHKWSTWDDLGTLWRWDRWRWAGLLSWKGEETDCSEMF